MKKKAALLVGMGFEITVLLWFFIYVGQKGDRYFDTGMGITTILILLALVIWFYQLIQLLR